MLTKGVVYLLIKSHYNISMSSYISKFHSNQLRPIRPFQNFVLLLEPIHIPGISNRDGLKLSHTFENATMRLLILSYGFADCDLKFIFQLYQVVRHAQSNIICHFKIEKTCSDTRTNNFFLSIDPHAYLQISYF